MGALCLLAFGKEIEKVFPCHSRCTEKSSRYVRRYRIVNGNDDRAQYAVFFVHSMACRLPYENKAVKREDALKHFPVQRSYARHS